jgi:hypothetical protein
VLLAKEQSLPILNVLGLTRPARAGLEFTTSRLLSESTTNRLQQPVFPIFKKNKIKKKKLNCKKYYMISCCDGSLAHGPNSVFSMIHHAFEQFGLGEEHCMQIIAEVI